MSLEKLYKNCASERLGFEKLEVVSGKWFKNEIPFFDFLFRF